MKKISLKKLKDKAYSAMIIIGAVWAIYGYPLLVVKSINTNTRAVHMMIDDTGAMASNSKSTGIIEACKIVIRESKATELIDACIKDAEFIAYSNLIHEDKKKVEQNEK